MLNKGELCHQSPHERAWGEKSRVQEAESHLAEEGNGSSSDLIVSTFSGGRG